MGLGLGSISWAGHQIHVAIPITLFLDSGVDPYLIPSANELISEDSVGTLYPAFSISFLPDFSWSLPSGTLLIKSVNETNPLNGSLYLPTLIPPTTTYPVVTSRLKKLGLLTPLPLHP